MSEEENEDEITSVHAGEPLLPPTAVGPVRPGALASARRVPEETVLLSTKAPDPGSRTEPLRPADSGWGTVVLPGGGHPDHVVDRTQLLALDEPDAAISATARLSFGAPEPVEAVDTGGLTSIRPPAGLEPFPGLPSTMRGPSPEAWAIPRVGLASAPPSSPAGPTGAVSAGGRAASTPAGGPAVPATGSASASAGDPAVPVGSPTDARSTAPPTDGPGTVPVVVSERRITAPPGDGPGTVPVAVAERRTTAVPTSGPPATPVSHPAVISGGHPVVSTAPNAGHPVPGPSSHPAVISGASPVVGVPPSGAHPLVISGGHPAVGATPTGGHPAVARSALRGRAPAPSADTRLAWGFLLGVLITVAIVSVAVALGLYLMG